METREEFWATCSEPACDMDGVCDKHSKGYQGDEPAPGPPRVLSYWDMARPTYIENWPQALCRLSIAQADVPLSLGEARALGTNIAEFGEGFVPLTPEQEAQQERAVQSCTDHANAMKALAKTLPDLEPMPVIDWRPGDISGVRSRVAAAVARFPKGAFVRLGSRSPKDAWSWRGPQPGRILPGGGDPLRYLLDCSERVSDDLQLALANGYAPHVFVREWVDIPAWAEFRCFMRGRRLVGVSQYQPRVAYPEVERERSLITWGVGLFFEHFRAASHLDDVVFDVFVKVRVKHNEGDIEVRLLEINPFGEFTDPCLFDHRGGGDFDRTFRYVGPDGRVRKTSL